MQCRQWNTDCQSVYDKLIKKGKSETDIIRAVKEYANEIMSRDPENNYSRHRFSLYDFLKQENGCIKFINK
jgi:hypothetical protein